MYQKSCECCDLLFMSWSSAAKPALGCLVVCLSSSSVTAWDRAANCYLAIIYGTHTKCTVHKKTSERCILKQNGYLPSNNDSGPLPSRTSTTSYTYSRSNISKCSWIFSPTAAFKYHTPRVREEKETSKFERKKRKLAQRKSF